jgi:cytochrome c biogenesis protein CcmG/thiol:disulfide interchange protein DsbE
VADRQRAQQRWAVAGVVTVGVVIIALVTTLSILSSRGGEVPDGYSADNTAFDLPSLTGEDHVRLADHRGTPVVVNFFATWCVYCNQELPGFVQVATATSGQVDFIGVQSRDTGDGVEMAERFGLAETGFALARDIGGENGSKLWSSYGSSGLPVTAFYDDKGTFLELSGGMLTQDELENKIETLYGITVDATDASTLQAPVIPLIPRGAFELLKGHAADGTFALIDARTPQQFAEEHITAPLEAVNLDATAADLDQKLAALPKDRYYIVYCQTDEKSQQLTATMHEQGFLHVYYIEGGFDAWKAAGG